MADAARNGASSCARSPYQRRAKVNGSEQGAVFALFGFLIKSLNTAQPRTLGFLDPESEYFLSASHANAEHGVDIFISLSRKSPLRRSSLQRNVLFFLVSSFRAITAG